MAQDNLAIASATTAVIKSMHDFAFTPQLIKELYHTYGAGFTIVDFLRKCAGRSIMVSGDSIKHQEEAYTHRTIKIGTVTPISIEEVSFTLDADDFDSQGNIYPRVGFNVLFGDTITGFTEARLTSIVGTAPNTVLTFKRYNTNAPTMSAQIAAGHIATGVEVTIGSSAFAPETRGTTPTTRGLFEREHFLQIFKEAIGFGGMELARQKWVEVQGVGLFNAELTRGEFLLDQQESMALWMGQQNNNSITQASAISGANNTVGKTIGVWDWIDRLGGEIGISSTGMDVDDLDAAAAYLKSQGITSDVVLVMGGGSFLRKAENNFIDKVNGTAGSLPESFLQAEHTLNGQPGMFLDFGFKLVKKSGILFCFVEDPILSNPKLLGNSHMKLEDAAMMFPMSMYKDPKSGLNLPNLYQAHAGLGGYSRKRIVGMFAGMDGFMQQNLNMPTISEIDGNNTHWLSNVGFPFMEANKALIIKRTS
ncbi:MAG: hypothetical protein WCQ70_09595 [Lentimicrobiaceae bacterium]